MSKACHDFTAKIEAVHYLPDHAMKVPFVLLWLLFCFQIKHFSAEVQEPENALLTTKVMFCFSSPWQKLVKPVAAVLRPLLTCCIGPLLPGAQAKV